MNDIPRIFERINYIYGFVIRRIFGYGSMDEMMGSMSAGMFFAERKELSIPDAETKDIGGRR